MHTFTCHYIVIILLSYSELHVTDRPNGPCVKLLMNKHTCNSKRDDFHGNRMSPPPTLTLNISTVQQKSQISMIPDDLENEVMTPKIDML